jgi:hypothetical protein
VYAAAFSVARLGEQRVLIRIERSGRLLSISKSEFAFLSCCKGVRTIDDHLEVYARHRFFGRLIESLQRCVPTRIKRAIDWAVRRFSRVLSPEQLATIPEYSDLLEELKGITRTEAVEKLPRHEHLDGIPTVRCPIRWIAIPTRRRPKQLKASLHSIVRNLRLHQRECALLVAIDGPMSDFSEYADQGALDSENDPEWPDVSYVNRDIKQNLIADLVRTPGASREVIEFALLGDSSRNDCYGANRNVIQLLTSGQSYISSDDDVLWETIATRENVGMEFSSRDPYRTRLHNADSVVPTSEFDIVGEHERWLDAALSDVIQECHFRTGDLCEHAKKHLCRRLGKIGTVTAGTFGNSGNKSQTRLMLDPLGVDYRRIQRSDRWYKKYERADDLLKYVPEIVCSHEPHRMAMLFAETGASDVPYFPFGRNEDGLHSLIVQRCIPDRYSVSLPFAVRHACRGGSSYFPWSDALRTPRLSEVLAAVTAAWGKDMMTIHQCNELGKELRTLAYLPTFDLQNELIKKLREMARIMLEEESQQHVEPSANSLWARNKRARETSLMETMKSSVFPNIRDLTGGVEEVRRNLRLYGALCLDWSSIKAAAVSLRESNSYIQYRSPGSAA